MKKPDSREIKVFQKTIWDFYKKEGRHDLPWRKTRDPYKILVSEMMLQQTQVDRVVPKYAEFLRRFPDIVSLSKADTIEVLKLWSGLGYNRRALFLKRAAESVVSDFGGKFPKDAETLETLHGIGPYTARAIATFSHNTPYIFVETNIRAVYINRFFPRGKSVSDKQLISFLEASLDRSNPREWYFALMDFGAHLKKTVPNPSRKSAHHAVQSRFEGSLRQMRGALLRKCTSVKKISTTALLHEYKKADKIRARKALTALMRDGFLEKDPKGYVKIK